MIDAREDVLTPVTHAGRRHNRKISASRQIKPAASEPKKTLRLNRVFSDAKIKPFDQIEWEKRTAEITDDAGKVIFKQENVEVPKSWSQLATKVVVSKYFYGEQNTSERETSVRQLIHRISRTIADWGRRNFLRRIDVALCKSIWRVQFASLVQRRTFSRIRRRQKIGQR
jgi:hypothetical protein